jgi:prophage regulatory protein
MTGNHTAEIKPKLVLLTAEEVAKRVPYSVSSIYRLMAAGDFPKSVSLGKGRTATTRWLEHEVDEWILSRVAARDAEQRKHKAALAHKMTFTEVCAELEREDALKSAAE